MASLHAKISYTKSAARVFGYVVGGYATKNPWLILAFCILILSEIIGIIEEFDC